MKLKMPNLGPWKHYMSTIYNLKEDYAKGRVITLADSVITSFYNAFVTGIFYTGFLSMYGMSITNVGIISFIPLLANTFCIFSSLVLAKFKRKKPILLASKILFYFLYIVATTIMPTFVKGDNARLIWFAVILFVAHAVYALFSSGFTPWFYAFYPPDNEKRTTFIAFNQTISSVMSSFVLMLSSVLTDVIGKSGHQETFILGMRYFAFLLVLVDVWVQGQAKEVDLPEGPKIKLKDIFVLPFRYKKFMMCLAMIFYWNFTANIPCVWNYHLLNHMNFSYTLINLMSVMYTVILIFTQSFWSKRIRLYSWIKVFGMVCLFWLPTELAFFFMSPARKWMYVPLCLIQNLLSVGMNLSYANILYLNLPKENSTVHIAFYALGANLFAFFGQLVGTAVSGISGDTPITLLGMEFYTVQYNTLIRTALMLTLGIVMVIGWRRFTPDEEIPRIEAAVNAHRKFSKLPIKFRRRIT